MVFTGCGWRLVATQQFRIGQDPECSYARRDGSADRSERRNKNMIRGGTGGADGAGGGDMHLHFHGPSDGPAVERWFSGLMARNPRVVANMLRSNALIPRSW